MAGAEIGAALRHGRLVALLETANHVVSAQSFRRFHDLVIRGVRAAILDGLQDRPGEQKIVLRHDSNLFVERLDGGGVQVDSVHRDAALLRFVKAGEQADDAGLS